MKSNVVILLVFLTGAVAGAILIDDFSDTTLSEYTKTVIMDVTAGYTAMFQSPSGTLQLTGGSTGQKEQILLLRDDYSLGIGQTLMADLDWGQTSRNDIGIVVTATATPEGVPDGQTGAAYGDYIAVVVQADNNNMKGVVADGTAVASVIYATGLPADPKNHVTGLYIRRDSAGSFTLGYVVDGSTYKDFATRSMTNTDIGKAIGFFGEFRTVTVFGDLDNLRIFCLQSEPTEPSPANGAAGVSIDTLLEWKGGAGYVYDVYLGTDISQMELVVSNLEELELRPCILNHDTTYYWQIIARNACGQSSGPVWSFMTEPWQILPANGAVDVPLDVTLEWDLSNGNSISRNSSASAGPAVLDPGIVYTGFEDPSLKGEPSPQAAPAQANAVIAGQGGPDAGGYYYFDNKQAGGPDFDWVEISANGTNLNLTDDSHYFPINLPFNFSFYGTNYNQIAVGSNGGVYFENQYFTLGNSCIPGSFSINRFIALYWDDLYPSGTSSNILYKVVGTAPYRKLIVQWQNVMHCCGTDGGYLTAQVQLHENGDILMLYANPSLEAGLGGTVGIQNGPQMGLQYLCNQTGLTAGLAILFTRNPDIFGTPSVYDVYLGTDISRMELAASDLEDPAFQPSLLSYDTTYYWKVIAKKDCGQMTSPIWSFTTEPWHTLPADGAVDVPINTFLKWNLDSSNSISRYSSGSAGPAVLDPGIVYTGFEDPSLKGEPSPQAAPAQANAVIAGQGGPDAGGYYYFDNKQAGGPDFDWVEISANGTNLNLTDDSHYFPINLPFNFSFYGTNYNQIAVGSNGGIYFENQYLDLSNSCIPGSFSINRFIALYWDDLYPSETGNVYYKVVGTAPYRKLIVQWQNVMHCCSSTNGYLTAQVQLHENGDILMLYADPSLEAGQGGTVGIQNDPQTGLQYLCNEAGLTAGLAILFTRNPGSIKGLYDVYLGTDISQMELAASDLEESLFQPCILDYGTTYYWQVVTKKGGEQTKSPIHSFTTEQWQPLPADEAVDVPIDAALEWNGPSGGCTGDVSCGIENGGFETGGFAPWVTVTGPGTEWFPWAIWDTTNGYPLEGNYHAICGFEGDAGLYYDIYQEVEIPGCAQTAIFNWSEYLAWEITSGTLPREYTVSIQPAGGGASLATLYSQQLQPFTSGAAGYVPHSVDLMELAPSIAGQTVRINFHLYIPESWTGYAFFLLDGASLTCGGQVMTLGPQNSPSLSQAEIENLVADYQQIRQQALTAALADRNECVWPRVGEGGIRTLQPAQTAAAAVSVGQITNGDFETGTFEGWTLLNELTYPELGYAGSFVINNGILDPYSPDGPLPSYAGNYSALSDIEGPGIFTLFQDVTLPADTTSLTLCWADMIRNHHTSFADPDQEYSVQIWNLNNESLATLFSTNPGDALMTDWTERSADIMAFAGQTVRVAFTVNVQLFFFNIHLDSIRIETDSTPPLPPASPVAYDVYLGTDISEMELVASGLEDPEFKPCILDYQTTYYWQVIVKDDCRQAASPVCSFTTQAWQSLPADGAEDVPIDTLLEWRGPSSGGCSGASCGIENGGFETGEFEPWTAVAGSATSELTEWNIGIGDRGAFSGHPFEGDLCAQNGFEGNAGLYYDLYQETSIPACASSVILTWSERIQWQMEGTLPREYTVSIQPAGGGEPLAIAYSFQLQPHTIGDTGYVTHAVDLLDLEPSIAGQTVRITFHEYIPESFTGPAQFDLDGISLTCAGQAPTEDPIVNGDFETGTFDGWTHLNSESDGAFVINDGTFVPDGEIDGALPPYHGAYSALCNQFGPGIYTIYQEVTLPEDVESLTLRWADRIRNHHTEFVDSSQEYSVQIWDLNNQSLATLFSTDPGDPLISDWTERSAGIMAFAGQTVRVAFTVNIQLFYFNVHLDDIRIETEGPEPIESIFYDVYFGADPADPGAWEQIGQDLNAPVCDPTSDPDQVLRKGRIYFWQVTAKKTCGSVTSPIWSFATENTPPVAESGQDQTVFCWIDGLVNITLNGSESYDEDENPLTYLWTWTIDGQSYSASGISPTLTLPAGIHTITLVVNDGFDDSEPDQVIVAAKAPVKASVHFTPKSLNCESSGKWVKIHCVMPEGYRMADINTAIPWTLEPLNLPMSQMTSFINEEGLLELEVSFDRDEFCQAGLPLGFNSLSMAGTLMSGQYFYGNDTVSILDNKMDHLLKLASKWLETGCGKPNWCDGQDINADTVVDIRDLALIQ